MALEKQGECGEWISFAWDGAHIQGHGCSRGHRCFAETRRFNHAIRNVSQKEVRMNQTVNLLYLIFTLKVWAVCSSETLVSFTEMHGVTFKIAALFIRAGRTYVVNCAVSLHRGLQLDYPNTLVAVHPQQKCYNYYKVVSTVNLVSHWHAI
jgi:hypothetical protein